MKKINLINSALLLVFLVSCNSNQNVTSESNSSLENISSESSQQTGNLLDSLKTNNITISSEYQIYYYPINNLNQKTFVQHFNTIAKYNDGMYSYVGYNFNTNQVVSQLNMKRGEDGYTYHTYVDLENQLKEEASTSNIGLRYKWEASIYYNQINDLNFSDLTKDGDRYLLSNKTVAENIAMSVLNTSSYDIDTSNSYFTIKDGKVESLVLQEVEADDVYEGYMYGRKAILTFKDINSTTITPVAPKENVPENDDLQAALTKLKGATNYTSTLTANINNEEIIIQKNLVTENDVILQERASTGDNNSFNFSGYHTVLDEENKSTLYTFKSEAPSETIGKLFGSLASEGDSISSHAPSMAFSEDLFTLSKTEDDGTKVYSIDSSYLEILDLVDFNTVSYSSMYNGSEAQTIDFYVKDQTLSQISFATTINTNSSADGSISGEFVTGYLKFSNVGSTTISEDSWLDFTTAEAKTYQSWNDITLPINLADGSTNQISLGNLFKQVLGKEDYFPYFLPNNISLIIENYSSIDEQEADPNDPSSVHSYTVSLSFTPTNSNLKDVFDNMLNSLKNTEFNPTDTSEEGFYSFMWSNEEETIDFGVDYMEGDSLINVNMTLPYKALTL